MKKLYNNVISATKRQRIEVYRLEYFPEKLFVLWGFYVPYKILGFKVGTVLRGYETSIIIDSKMKLDDNILNVALNDIVKKRNKSRKYRRTLMKLTKILDNDTIRLHTAAKTKA